MVAPVGVGVHGETYNINADLVACHVACALSALRLIYLTDVDGVLDENKNRITPVKLDEIPRMISQKVITGGMIPKIEYAKAALESGIQKVHIINGCNPHAVILELFTDKGIGTEVVQ